MGPGDKQDRGLATLEAAADDAGITKRPPAGVIIPSIAAAVARGNGIGYLRKGGFLLLTEGPWPQLPATGLRRRARR